MTSELTPETMNPAWSQAHSKAAIAEGWEIFDCDGSCNGRWQVDCIDTPADWEHLNDGVAPPKLENDEAAWAIVANGNEPHHGAAREFLKAHNPAEYDLVMKFKKEST